MATHGRAPRAGGFTLIELLIAITILAVVAILSWRGLDQIVRGREAVSAVMANERVIAQAFDQIGSDARAAAQDDDTGGGAAIALGDGWLQIVRYFDRPEQAPRLQVVRYVLSDRQLSRWASPPLATVDAVQRAMRANGAGPGWSRVTLIAGMASLGTQLWVDGLGWATNDAIVRDAAARARAALTNPATQGAPLLRSITGLEVSVRVGDAGQTGQTFTRVYLVGQ